MPSRHEHAYRLKLRALLAHAHAQPLDPLVERLLRRARARSRRQGRPLARVLAELDLSLHAAVDRRGGPHASAWHGTAEPPRMLCDASLGGLARWVRAAGYEARTTRGRTDDAVREALAAGEVLLTSNGRVLERTVVRQAGLACVWVPTSLTSREQVALVLRELGLRPRAPRCMACGGELRPVDKEAVRERIPPRTARWKDEYFLCARCGRLFWQGTHWERIVRRLAEATAGRPQPS